MYGEYIRAWRCALSQGDFMTMPRPTFMKACADLGFKETKAIWAGLGKTNDCAAISFEDLDVRSGIILAKFRSLVVEDLGGYRAAFDALDRRNLKMLRQDDFVEVLKRFEFEENTAKLLFHGLDKDGNKYLL
eukprot:TRINITY_DN3652_c0_g1_i2.p3 TRINITY_DN3652_c0_g1~~TRINITY_DN3652_c0_g1_i2.p3  ORF type:complete len:132 (-),score=43.74 TRINITY_DN3652_c0_g1_i2:137-532(-)